MSIFAFASSCTPFSFPTRENKWLEFMLLNMAQFVQIHGYVRGTFQRSVLPWSCSMLECFAMSEHDSVFIHRQAFSFRKSK